MLEEREVSFAEQSEKWLQWATTRSRKPILLTSVPTIRGALDNYILPEIGLLPLSKVHNGTCKGIVDNMKKEGLASSSMNGYFNVVKAVMKSVIDPETGEPKYNRRWNSTFLDLPLVEHAKQPILVAGQIESMLAEAKYSWERLLYLVLASSGLRISEALGLEWSHLINDGRTLSIVQKVNRFGKLMPRLKTRAGKRQVDVHPEVAKELLAARHGRDGLMFPSREGTPLSSNNVERRLLRTHVTGSWHQFRRFRSTWLRKNRCLEDLKDIWLGHKRPVLDEAYIRMREDVETRLAEAERVGLGFKIVPLGEVKIRRIGKPRGWTRGKSARRVGVGEVVGKRRLRED